MLLSQQLDVNMSVGGDIQTRAWPPSLECGPESDRELHRHPGTSRDQGSVQPLLDLHTVLFKWLSRSWPLCEGQGQFLTTASDHFLARISQGGKIRVRPRRECPQFYPSAPFTAPGKKVSGASWVTLESLSSSSDHWSQGCSRELSRLPWTRAVQWN